MSKITGKSLYTSSGWASTGSARMGIPKARFWNLHNLKLFPLGRGEGRRTPGATLRINHLLQNLLQKSWGGFSLALKYIFFQIVEKSKMKRV